MKNLQKKISCVILALLLFAGTAMAAQIPVNAKVITILEPAAQNETAAPGVPITKEFTITSPCQTALAIAVAAPCAFTVSVYNSADIELDSMAFSPSDPDWLPLNDFYINDCTIDLAAGDYKAVLTFEEMTEYQFTILADVPEAAISNTTLTITEGFTKTLSISDNAGAVTWKSSKPAVADVNSQGKVTAKKAGKCTVTAAVDGKTLKCTVTVKSNKYTASKLTNSEIPRGSASWEAYSASYDESGNLVIKCRMVNNSGHYSEYLKNLSIKVKTAEKKTAASYKASKMKLYVSDQGYKDFKITIKKADLKIKKADLRNASITTDGKYGYTYYTYN